MSDQTTRRGFLGKTAAVGGCLALPGLRGVARSAETVGDSSSIAINGPVTVITQSLSTDVNPRAGTWIYITEILQRAGVFFNTISPDDVSSLLGRSQPIVLLAGNLPLTTEQREVLTSVVKRGGSIIGIGGTSGLDKVFGVSRGRRLTEGWMKVTAQDHPVMAGLRSSLHVFGGHVMSTGSAVSLADLESGYQGAKGNAIAENRFGKGRAILLAPDLLFSIVHIQQGVSVLQDATPSPEGSAPFNDGELKSEDGFVLDWQRDRTTMPSDDGQVFLEPITDELREIIVRSILYVAREQGIALPMLWYWPRGLKAIGHISHDTDGNEPQKAEALLEVVNRCDLKSTWCTLFPGGYPREFYDTLKDQGFEIGLHYDARTGGTETWWSKANLILQHRWLMQEAGLDHVTTNKNHYLRWESRLDFLRWCEEIGINSDQTRGPSKRGATGFPLGGSQPYFPLDDQIESPRYLNVLEVNMLTQDLVVVCPREYGKPLVDSVLRHHGVAHFLFHPAHIQKPHVADAFSELVDYGRTQGLEWWMSQRIYQWEMQRRSVKAEFDAPDKFTLSAGKQLSDATLLFLKSREEPQAITINGQAAQSDQLSRHGFEFDAVTMDLAGETKVQVA